MIPVKCTKGKVAMVSERDYARVSSQRWYAQEQRLGCWYAYNRHRESMHRYIMRAKKGFVVDHIDGNGLNNVRENLRICTQEQNSANARMKTSGPFGWYRGIRQAHKTGKYFAHAIYRGQRIKGGMFDTPEEAARDYDRIKIMLYGEYALTHEKQGLLNNPPEETFREVVRNLNK